MSIGPRGPLLIQDHAFLEEMAHFDRSVHFFHFLNWQSVLCKFVQGANSRKGCSRKGRRCFWVLWGKSFSSFKLLALSFKLIDEDRKWAPSFFSFSFCLTPSLLNFNTSRAQTSSCYFSGHPRHLQVLQSSSLQQGIVTRTTITIVCSRNRERVQLCGLF